MNALEKLDVLAHILKWRLTWNRKDLNFKPDGLANPKFMSALEAVRLIPDGATTFSCGMAANAPAKVWFWAIAQSYRETGHPRGLTHVIVGAQGGRGRVPGTVEELGRAGCVVRFIAGHHETVKSMLHLAEQGEVELHTLPQGIEALLIEAQARGIHNLESETGVGTFLDPRVGLGSVVVPGKGRSLIEAAGPKLRYNLPPLDVAFFVAPAADAEGNIYIDHCALYTESYESAQAVKTNGGKVLVSVAEVIDNMRPHDIFLPADKVDAVVVHPFNEQTNSVPQKKYWKMFTEGAGEDLDKSMAKLRYINRVLGITPKRGAVDDALARLAADLFTRQVRKCCNIIVGVGLPEEVSRLIYEGGLFKDVTFMSETGVVGGLPAPGVFFGAAVNPKEIVSSAQVFHLCYEHLDAAILGILEADSQGNLNVSRRGPGPLDYVGPGGFPDFCAAADTIVFVGSWMAHARMQIVDGRLAIVEPGPHKFIARVSEITMSGAQALAKKKNVFYVTNVGIFQLTPKGMMLIEVMPGIDIRKDILEACPMRVVLPDNGEVPVTEASIVTGRGFKLEWRKI